MAAENNDDMLWGWQSKTKNITERGKHILGTDLLSDVTFRVGSKDGEPVDIKAHKCLLAMGSAVFEAMFYGDIRETTSIVPITDIDPEPFRILLRYLYHQQIGPFDNATTFPVLYACKKYGVPIVKAECEKYLRRNVTVENCPEWFVQADIYDEPMLADYFLLEIDSHGPLVLESADFMEVNNGTLEKILSRDSLKVREVDVYDAVIKWAKNGCANREIQDTGANLRAALGNALYLIRFPIMTSEEVESGPVTLGLFLDEEFEQLRSWFATETIPGSFNTTRRQVVAEMQVKRFGDKLDGWTYAAGKPNEIRLCIASMTDKTNRTVDSASVSLVAVGFYLSSVSPTMPTPIYHQVEERCRWCGVRSNVSRLQLAASQPSPVISLKVYIEEGPNQKELEEFRETFWPPSEQTGEHVQKMILDKPVPLKLYQHYIISAEIKGIQKSYCGMEGKNRVTAPASSGDLNVTVEFSSVLEGAISGIQALMYGREQPSGITSVLEGQLPEFYFEVTG